MKGHRPFILLSLTVSSILGSGLGGWVLLAFMGWVWLGDLGTILQAHGQLQVYGFVAMFTMGVAVMMFCSPMQLPAQPLWLAYLCPALMLVGIGFQVASSAELSPLPPWFGPATQTLSILAFALVLGRTRQKSLALSRRRDSFTAGQIALLACGTFWLLVAPALGLKDLTKALETVLWGFTGLYIVAVGLRTHPSILGLPARGDTWLPLVAGLWNLALALRWLRGDGFWSLVMACAVAIFLTSLHPFRRSQRPPAGGTWLRPFVRTSYLWLIVATVLTALAEGPLPQLTGAARHALGSGFVVTMIVGMSLRMVCAYEVRRLLWSSGPWVLYGLLTLATALRVLGQAVSAMTVMVVGGCLQVLAVWLFAALLAGTCLWGQYLGVKA